MVFEPGGVILNVLLIEDNKELAEDLELFLPDINLSWVPGTKDALKFLEQHSAPNAIILDLYLPPFLAKTEENEGFELLSLLKEKRARDIPVVVLSNLSREEAEVECLQRKASVYLQKPCPAKEIMKHLNNLTSFHRR